MHGLGCLWVELLSKHDGNTFPHAHLSSEGRQDNRGQGQARGQDTLSYVIKRSHDKLKREKMFNLDFAMADFAIILPILS